MMKKQEKTVFKNIGPNKKLKGIALLTILALAILTVPSLISGQINASNDHTMDISKLLKTITERYLNTFGYNSSEKIQYTETITTGNARATGSYNDQKNGVQTIVNFSSLLKLENGNPQGYAYEANFTTGEGKQFGVEESNLKTTYEKVETTNATQKITGSMTYSASIVENKTITEAFVNTEREIYIQFDNASDRFFYNLYAVGIWNPNMTILDSLNATIDQNIINPSGHYLLTTKTNDSGQLKFDLTKPDGTILDPGAYSYADEYDIYNNHLQGWLFWSTVSDIPSAVDWALFLAGAVFVFINPTVLVGLTLVIIQGLGMVGDYFIANISGTQVRISYVLWLEWFGIPWLTEMGYYTNQYSGQPLGNWWYWPLFAFPYTSETGWNYAHTGVWPT